MKTSILTRVRGRTQVILAGVVVALAARTGTSQCQTQKLLPSVSARAQLFGQWVAMDGDWAVISALDDEVAQGSGALYVFHKDPSGWVQTQKLKENDPTEGDTLGFPVAISGDVIVAGAFAQTHDGIQAAGAAYVFERSGTTWSQTAKLVASDAGAFFVFGYAVAVSGTRILVGSKDEDHAGAGSGAAYVFDKVGAAWTQTMKLTAPDGAAGDEFGAAVALSGDVAMIAAPVKPGIAGAAQGAVYLFQNSGGTWAGLQVLRSSDAHDHDYFGTMIACSGTTLVADAWDHVHAGANFQGGAYVFENQGTGWVETSELRPGNGNCVNYGISVAVTSEHVLVGARGDYAGGLPRGSAFDYRRVGSAWTQVGKLRRETEPNDNGFGFSVAASGEIALVAAPYDDTACPQDPACNSGSVFELELAPTAMQFGACASGAPCANPDASSGCRNSTGYGAVLAACGSGSASLDDLRIEATHCPPNKLTLLFMAPMQSYVAYGDGIRTVRSGGGIGLYRLGGMSADADGIARRGPGIVAQTQHLPPAGRIQAGETWNFQVWYRDANGPCHTGTNFTNGVQVAFLP